MRVLVAFDQRDQVAGFGRVAHVPDFMARGAVGAQQIGLVGIALRQRLAVADAHHLRAAGFALTGFADDVGQVFGFFRIGDVDDRSAVVFRVAGDRIDVFAAVVADIGDPAITLLDDQRLVGTARLQVVVTDQAHVFRLDLA